MPGLETQVSPLPPVVLDGTLAVPRGLPDAMAGRMGKGGGRRVHYPRRPIRSEPDFGVASVDYDFAELLDRAETPS